MRTFKGIVVAKGRRIEDEGIRPYVTVDDGDGHALTVGESEGDSVGGAEIGDQVEVVMTVRVVVIETGR